MLERLQATTVNDDAWKTVLGKAEQGSFADLRRIRVAKDALRCQLMSIKLH